MASWEAFRAEIDLGEMRRDWDVLGSLSNWNRFHRPGDWLPATRYWLLATGADAMAIGRAC